MLYIYTLYICCMTVPLYDGAVERVCWSSSTFQQHPSMITIHFHWFVNDHRSHSLTKSTESSSSFHFPNTI